MPQHGSGYVQQPETGPAGPQAEIGILGVGDVGGIEQADRLRHLPAHHQGTAGHIPGLLNPVVLPLIGFPDPPVADDALPEDHLAPRIPEQSGGIVVVDLRSEDPRLGVRPARLDERRDEMRVHLDVVVQEDDPVGSGRERVLDTDVVPPRPEEVAPVLDQGHPGVPFPDGGDRTVGGAVVGDDDLHVRIVEADQRLQAGQNILPIVPGQHHRRHALTVAHSSGSFLPGARRPATGRAPDRSPSPTAAASRPRACGGRRRAATSRIACSIWLVNMIGTAHDS